MKDHKEYKLKRCPFCGGEAEMKQNEFVGHQRVYIQCTSCHAVSCIQTEGQTMAFKDIPSRYVSIDECRQKSVERWNRRAREGYVVVAGGVTV
ncbi:Lar family restriction alleviation protein [Faecalicatena contorta]|uniref:Lar family restriction alleviation protein n=1 Tax=Faecalicatena contorta TaxID=39482 RepID=UPI001FB92B5B|nr:Lar family restriction alleviation protein [Faecalicatena contorta]GKH33502.1 hypothetical protein CE91St64_29090 [Faecalicatena contorta]